MFERLIHSISTIFKIVFLVIVAWVVWYVIMLVIHRLYPQTKAASISTRTQTQQRYRGDMIQRVRRLNPEISTDQANRLVDSLLETEQDDWTPLISQLVGCDPHTVALMSVALSCLLPGHSTSRPLFMRVRLNNHAQENNPNSSDEKKQGGVVTPTTFQLHDHSVEIQEEEEQWNRSFQLSELEQKLVSHGCSLRALTKMTPDQQEAIYQALIQKPPPTCCITLEARVTDKGILKPGTCALFSARNNEQKTALKAHLFERKALEVWCDYQLRRAANESHQGQVKNPATQEYVYPSDIVSLTLASDVEDSNDSNASNSVAEDS
jgi:hypothetical protein